jgi:hypothetical protein
MYRPQFSFPPAQAGTYDDDFVYSFDPYNTPALDIRFGPGQATFRIPLQLQSDAAFVHRATKMNPSAESWIGVQLFFPDDTPLSDDHMTLSALSANTGNPAPIIEGGDNGEGMLSSAGASYQVDIINRSATQSTLPLAPAIGPVLVDPVGFGHGPVIGNNVPTTSTFGPFLYNGALYMALTPTVGTFVLQMFQSIDGGATWQGLDLSNSPNGNAMPVFDGNHTVVVAFSTSAVDVDGSINLINFDLSTGTWGPVYGTAGAPTTQAVYGIYIRPDGSYIVLHNPIASGPTPGSTGMFAAVFAAGVWVTNFDAGTGITGLPGYDDTLDSTDWSTAVLDAAGNLHLFFSTSGSNGPPNWNGRVFYQQILPTNALGTFVDIPGNNVSPPKIQTIDSANAVIVGNSVVLGIQQFDTTLSVSTFNNVIVGTPLSAPAFSYAPEPGIDPNAFNILTPNADVAPYLFYDGRTLFAVSVYDTAALTANELRLEFTNTPATPASGWGSVPIYNYADSGLPVAVFQGFLRPSLNIVNQVMYLSAELPAPNDARYFLGSVTIEPIRIQLRGVKRYVRTSRKQTCALNKG